MAFCTFVGAVCCTTASLVRILSVPAGCAPGYLIRGPCLPKQSNRTCHTRVMPTHRGGQGRDAAQRKCGRIRFLELSREASHVASSFDETASCMWRQAEVPQPPCHTTQITRAPQGRCRKPRIVASARVGITAASVRAKQGGRDPWAHVNGVGIPVPLPLKRFAPCYSGDSRKRPYK